MTREEIIQAISDDKMMPFIQPEQLAQIVAFVIKNCKPSLPSNLDEAAEEIASDIAPTHPDIGWDVCFEKIKEGIKAGAEWMAGQGVSVDGKVVMDFSEPYDIINRRLIAKLGDALLKVEPGEVIVQIRKKQ